MPRPRKPANPFRYFHSSPEIIWMVVMLYVRYPLSSRNVENLLFERGYDFCHETVRLWWNRFGPMFAAEIRRRRVGHMRGFPHWRWHLDEVYVKLNGEMAYLWRAVDHEGEILGSFVTKKRDKPAALAFMKRALKRHGKVEKIVTDGLRSYCAAIQAHAEAHRYGVVREFCGHGVGRLFHDAPEVVHAARAGTGPELKPGMFLTIEPMINLGKAPVKMLADGWTAVTRDKSLSAQFEHSIGITDTGCEIFTASAKGLNKPPY